MESSSLPLVEIENMSGLSSIKDPNLIKSIRYLVKKYESRLLINSDALVMLLRTRNMLGVMSAMPTDVIDYIAETFSCDFIRFVHQNSYFHLASGSPKFRINIKPECVFPSMKRDIDFHVIKGQSYQRVVLLLTPLFQRPYNYADFLCQIIMSVDTFNAPIEVIDAKKPYFEGMVYKPNKGFTYYNGACVFEFNWEADHKVDEIKKASSKVSLLKRVEAPTPVTTFVAEGGKDYCPVVKDAEYYRIWFEEMMEHERLKRKVGKTKADIVDEMESWVDPELSFNFKKPLHDFIQRKAKEMAEKKDDLPIDYQDLEKTSFPLIEDSDSEVEEDDSDIDDDYDSDSNSTASSSSDASSGSTPLASNVSSTTVDKSDKGKMKEFADYVSAFFARDKPVVSKRKITSRPTTPLAMDNAEFENHIHNREARVPNNNYYAPPPQPAVHSFAASRAQFNSARPIRDKIVKERKKKQREEKRSLTDSCWVAFMSVKEVLCTTDFKVKDQFLHFIYIVLFTLWEFVSFQWRYILSAIGALMMLIISVVIPVPKYKMGKQGLVFLTKEDRSNMYWFWFQYDKSKRGEFFTASAFANTAAKVFDNDLFSAFAGVTFVVGIINYLKQFLVFLRAMRSSKVDATYFTKEEREFFEIQFPELEVLARLTPKSLEVPNTASIAIGTDDVELEAKGKTKRTGRSKTIQAPRSVIRRGGHIDYSKIDNNDFVSWFDHRDNSYHVDKYGKWIGDNLFSDAEISVLAIVDSDGNEKDYDDLYSDFNDGEALNTDFDVPRTKKDLSAIVAKAVAKELSKMKTNPPPKDNKKHSSASDVEPKVKSKSSTKAKTKKTKFIDNEGQKDKEPEEVKSGGKSEEVPEVSDKLKKDVNKLKNAKDKYIKFCPGCMINAPNLAKDKNGKFLHRVFMKSCTHHKAKLLTKKQLEENKAEYQMTKANKITNIKSLGNHLVTVYYSKDASFAQNATHIGDKLILNKHAMEADPDIYVKFDDKEYKISGMKNITPKGSHPDLYVVQTPRTIPKKPMLSIALPSNENGATLFLRSPLVNAGELSISIGKVTDVLKNDFGFTGSTVNGACGGLYIDNVTGALVGIHYLGCSHSDNRGLVIPKN